MHKKKKQVQLTFPPMVNIEIAFSKEAASKVSKHLIINHTVSKLVKQKDNVQHWIDSLCLKKEKKTNKRSIVKNKKQHNDMTI